jgi:nickel-dependent lactate racemase
LDPKAEVLGLDGNPVHEDFMEALQLFNRNQDVFSIQLLLNSRQEICYTNSGHIIDSFNAAVEEARKVYTRRVKGKADIIIAITKPPLDLDLYQSLKSVENTKLALEDDGVMILVSKCLDGIGNRSFYELLAGGSDAIGRARETKPFGCHKAIKFSDLLDRARVFAVTSLPPRDLEAIGVRAFDHVQKAMEEATQLKGPESQVLVVNDAAVTVPVPDRS